MDHLFFDHIKSVFFNSATAMLIFTILLYGFTDFHTHKTDDSYDASTSFFLIFFFSSHLSPTATALSFCLDLHNEWWVNFSFSSALITAKRFLLSFSSALTFRRTLHGNFREERLARKDTLKIEIGSGKIQNLNPHHFLPLENCLTVVGLNPGLHSQSCLWCIYCKALMQTWKWDKSSSRWGYWAFLVHG